MLRFGQLSADERDHHQPEPLVILKHFQATYPGMP